MKDGASPCIPGIFEIASVSQVGWNRSSVLIPPMKLEDGSEPRGGRVKGLCWLWKMPVRSTRPVVPSVYSLASP